ncbi:glucans biosynthesis protein G [Gemmobacter lanyuensis]|uniref:Glucans biosynthesis protein G n=1 Tax=Gemmobacter lanyuensis TaxID=1054497 RepID=A0A918INS4_9RHOB|nr:glucan biosynthesis protein G [Gemmobacter lanyuensis]GGW24769.1 glucans biosynthesis protein G [Gemmobacter lanyuensis]
MLFGRAAVPSLSRRALILAAASTSALSAIGLRSGAVLAQDAPAAAAPQQFSFDSLTAAMKDKAAQPYVAPEKISGFFAGLKYDDYRLVSYDPERARWAGDEGSQFQLHAFPMGWLFAEPVNLYEVKDGVATDMPFTTDDFRFLNELAAKVPAGEKMPGVAGFRLHYPLNRLDVMDEVVAFLGASYFRALGAASGYGLSARGLALNTATDTAEEFPRFSSFWVEKPAPGVREVVVYAALESPSVTGAYRFAIRPGEETEMDVTARLFFRADVLQLGIAPLTSMYLFSERNRHAFDDYRPQVHDSDGLRITRADGDVLWRPLNNPPRLSGAFLAEENPRAFGLHQRDRDFEHYQDSEARYERRPSLEVEPIGDWGKGVVRLVEIPSDLEVNDNIVAFWTPEGAIKAGDSREFAYRLRWGNLPVEDRTDLAWVLETRSGVGGVSGVESAENTRKFVIDFTGGPLNPLPADGDVTPILTVHGGEIVAQSFQRVWGSDVWRLAFDVKAEEGATVEMVAHLAGYGRKLTETWLYQWINA